MLLPYITRCDDCKVSATNMMCTVAATNAMLPLCDATPCHVCPYVKRSSNCESPKCETFQLRNLPSAESSNCGTFQLRNFPIAKPSNCETFQLRNLPNAELSKCGTFQLRNLSNAEPFRTPCSPLPPVIPPVLLSLCNPPSPYLPMTSPKGNMP